MTDTERRYTRGLVEVRAAGDQPQIGGYAAKFGRRSQNLGGFVEQIDKRFFNKSQGDGFPGVMARYNHDDNYLLGTTAGGTLRLSIDDTGLDYTVDPPTHRADVVELVTRGDVSQSSFAFITFDDDWALGEDDIPLRTLLSGKLIDVAPVNTPAYLDTSSGLRSLATLTDAAYEEVSSAAQADDLRKFFGSRAPVVYDLGKILGKRAGTAEDPADTTLAPETKETLVQVLQLVAAADNAVDVAQDILADLIDVPNPDETDVTVPDGDEPRSIPNGGQGNHPAGGISKRLAELEKKRRTP